jgi:hypothetical protein
MADEQPTQRPLTPLEFYQALLRWLYAHGYSSLNAHEQIQAWYPTLGPLANAEVWQKTQSGEFPSAPYRG